MFKFILIISMMVLASGVNSQVKLSKEMTFAKEFLDEMRMGEDIRSYLSEDFIKQNQLDNTDWQADYFLIKYFTIAQIEEMVIHVEIDHGIGKFCTSFELVLINENGKLKILPSGFLYSGKIKRHIVSPWRNRKKLC
jgi:hypothetical protein